MNPKVNAWLDTLSGKKILVLGLGVSNRPLVRILLRHGLDVTGCDATPYEKLDDGCRLIRNGATYLCTHPDFNCPTDTGFMPDSGAIAALITASTNVTPRYLGKPYPEVVEMIERVTGIPREKTCIFGDRLYTDIALGAKNGVTSILVLTGEGTYEEAMELPEGEKPAFIFPSLAEVDEAVFG